MRRESRGQKSEVRSQKSEVRLTADRRSLISDSSAFTLIEILAVIVIISVLVGVVLGTAGYVQRKAAIVRAKAEISAMEVALENYKLTIGNYPPNGPGVLHQALAGSAKKYMTFQPKNLEVVGSVTNVIDPFGSPYYYWKPGSNNIAGFDLWSAGPDTNSSVASDDITNWK